MKDVPEASEGACPTVGRSTDQNVVRPNNRLQRSALRAAAEPQRWGGEGCGYSRASSRS
jgi:hypothetical protein